MPQEISGDEARAICRSPKPSVSAMKKVIEWARKSPTPDKVDSLLVSQTGNYASRKGLGEALQQTLIECSREDTSHLWECIEGDWDTYRVWHALRTLAAIGAPADLERMIGLGRTKIMRIHWQVISDAVVAAGRAIPPDILSAQQQLETERGSSDFSAEFFARKQTWPSERDQLGTERPTPARKAGSISGTAAKLQRSAAPASNRTTALPKVFSPDGEQNPYLERYKASLARQWSLTRMERLFEAVDLAFFLTALGRAPEALAVVSYVADNSVFTGNYNLWTPAGYAICLQARLLHLARREEEAQAVLERIREHPFMAPPNRVLVENKIASLEGELAKAFTEKSTKWSCHKLARSLDSICYYLETGMAGFPHAAWYSVPRLEQLMDDGLAKLRHRLEPA